MDDKYLQPSVQSRLDRFGVIAKTYLETRSLYKRRKALTDETLKVQQKIYREMEKEVKYLLKHITAYRILKETGMEFENIVYPIRKKLLKNNEITRDNIKQPDWK